jgi:hypothetical protein
MYSATRRLLCAVVATVSLGSAVSWAADTDQQQARLRELENKVATLEAQEATNSKDLANTVDAVLRDAERRSQLLANGGDMGAGYDNGFYIRAGDAWVLRPGAQFQFRYIADFRDDANEDDGDNSDDIENGFETRRMKLSLEGTAFSPDLTYKFQWRAATDGGDVALEEAWTRYMFSDDWGFRLGQFKDPVFHEELTSSKYQLAADRSMVNSILGIGEAAYTEGATLIYGGYNKNNPLNVEVGLTNGVGQDNTSFANKDFNFGVAGRAEWKVMGDWKSYRDFSAKGNKEDLLVIGAGGDWSQSGDGDILLGTVDAQYENASGLGVYGAFLVDNLDEEFTGSGDSETDYGGLIQVGYLLNPSWELFGRYDITFFDQDQINGEDTFDEITVGVNYFLGQDGSAFHRAKFTVDLTYLPNGSPRPVSGLGILDDNGSSNEWILRAQFQLLI